MDAMNESKHYKWTYGEPYEQSKRGSSFAKKTAEMETSAYLASLNHDENSWEILNPQVIDYKMNNKREELEHKLSERDTIPRTNMNPFMTNNHFSEDMDAFLKPQGTKLTNTEIRI